MPPITQHPYNRNITIALLVTAMVIALLAWPAVDYSAIRSLGLYAVFLVYCIYTVWSVRAEEAGILLVLAETTKSLPGLRRFFIFLVGMAAISFFPLFDKLSDENTLRVYATYLLLMAVLLPFLVALIKAGNQKQNTIDPSTAKRKP